MRPICILLAAFLLASLAWGQETDPIQQWVQRSDFLAAVAADGKMWERDFRTLPLEEAIKRGKALEERWHQRDADCYTSLVTRIATDLSSITSTNDDAQLLAARWGQSILNRLPETSAILADQTLRKLIRSDAIETKAKPQLWSSVTSEQLLNSGLALIQRTEAAIGTIEPSTVPTLLSSYPQVPDGVMQINGIPALPITDPDLRAAFARNIEIHEELHRRRSLYSYFSKDRDNNLQTLEGEFARYVQRRFSLAPADLLKIQSALKRNIHDPILRDKLIGLFWGRENPLLGIPDDLRTGDAGPSLDAVTQTRRKSANQGSGSSEPSGAPIVVPDGQGNDTRFGKSYRSLPYLPLAAVFAAGVVLWWFLTRSRPR